jgi:predicted O-linked N-acetylglucosamine transferase (SPINDLY family)
MHATLNPPAARRAGTRHWERGREHMSRREWNEAARAFTRATEAAPSDELYWLNLAQAERRAGALERAEAAARRVLLLQPGHALALQMLGETLAQQHRYAESAEVFAQLEASGTLDPEAMVRHGSMLMALHRPREAFDVLMRALSRKPALLKGHAVLADACRDLGLKREAAECMKTVLALDPGNLEALNHLSFEKRHIADWNGFDEDLDRIAAALAGSPPGLARVTAAFAALSLPLPPALQRVGAEQESAAIGWAAAPLPPLGAAERATRAARSRVRVGFVSYDFREHPVSQLLVEMLEGLDRTRFELLLYSSGPDDGSALRARLQRTADHFVDLRGLSDAEAAARLRADGVDIAIDLMGHTRGHRLGVFASRPAPLQLGFLGYPGTTGAGFIDHFVGDAITAPLAHEAQFSEKIAQLPGCFQPNGRWRPLPQPMSRAEAGLPEGAFVMCAFNHTYKIGPEAFDTWCRVMRRVPHAVLWLKETNRQLHDNVRREAAARGVAPERIVFAPQLSYEAHFSRLALADVFVDTWPYNAHTTAADALWAGVPVLTLPGESFASRVAASVLAAVGLEGLAMASVADYEAALVTMATDAEVLPGLRAHLVDNRLQLPLFDSAGYTRRFEALLGALWGRWCAGLPPAHLPAEQVADKVAEAAAARQAAPAAPPGA